MRAVSNQESLCCELPLNVVDLWFAKLPDNDFSLETLLSPDEMRRASRFRLDGDAANFVVRRGILRLILASYTGVPPSQLTFSYSQSGKPALDGCFFDTRFSMSRSGELAVYAVAHRRDVGVDLEHLRQGALEISRIAGSFFSESQIAALNDTAADHQEEMFLHLWTQLEARGKARGTGIGQVNPRANEWNAIAGKCSSFIKLTPSPGYVVALAVQGRRSCSVRTLGFHMVRHMRFEVSQLQGTKNVEDLKEDHATRRNPSFTNRFVFKGGGRDSTLGKTFNFYGRGSE
jgi:4'-phosphopantetheinyl transferase